MVSAVDAHGVGPFTGTEINTQCGDVGDAVHSGDNRGDLRLVGGVAGVGEPFHVSDTA